MVLSEASLHPLALALAPALLRNYIITSALEFGKLPSLFGFHLLRSFHFLVLSLSIKDPVSGWRARMPTHTDTQTHTTNAHILHYGNYNSTMFQFFPGSLAKLVTSTPCVLERRPCLAPPYRGGISSSSSPSPSPSAGPLRTSFCTWYIL